MDVESKIKADMKNLGCTSQHKISLGYQLYIYLIDIKLMYDVEYCYNKDIDVMYVVAKPSKNERLNIYVPLPTTDDVNMELVDILQENLCTVETGRVVNLAFIDGDSTIVMYNFTKGLMDIQSPECLKRRKTREERRNFIDNELKRTRKEILKKALEGGVVDDDDDCEMVD